MRLLFCFLTASVLSFGAEFSERWSAAGGDLQAFEQTAKANKWETFEIGTRTGAEIAELERRRINAACAGSTATQYFYFYQMPDSAFQETYVDQILEKMHKAIHAENESFDVGFDKDTKLMAFKNLLGEVPRPYSVELFTVFADCPGAYKAEHWIIHDLSGHFSVSLGNRDVLR